MELINAFHKAREYETILIKIYFTAFFRRERQLWPSPLTMNVPEKFFSFQRNGGEDLQHLVWFIKLLQLLANKLLETADHREVTG